jgi:glycosyltransferase involved in cell wall biosynthesis|tara:strand:- start:160 stop:882 length:723 start_codon:yes stop_codon:yes gene_type:complete
MKEKFLIFIPAYNVEDKIFNVLNQIPKKIFRKEKVDILIINDNSKDNTKKIIIKLKKKFKFKIKILNNRKNLGYGGVQKKAYKYAIKQNYENVIMLHGDGQYTPKKIPKFIQELKTENFDAVFGTRMWSLSSAIKGGMPIYKFFGNIFLTKIQNLILGIKMSEFHSGYRSYKVKSLKKINLNKLSNRFHFDTEIIIQFIIKKFTIKEIPIPTIYRDEVSHLKSIPYGINVLLSTIKAGYR